MVRLLYKYAMANDLCEKDYSIFIEITQEDDDEHGTPFNDSDLKKLWDTKENDVSEMLKLENIQIIESAKDWKEAIHLSLEPLVNGGYVTENYEAAIIKCTEEYGPYYVLADDIALIHGRPEDGVLEKQLSITVVRQPIQFMNDGQNVRVLIALGASDANSHIDVMKVLS